jgi:hypothetical protein
MDTTKTTSILLIHIILPLFLGTLIYALWCGIVFIDPIKQIFPLISSTQTPNWVKYNLPDGLWVYSFLSTFYLIWRHMISKYFIAWILLAIILSFFLELLQAMHIIPGTFDWFDLLAYALSVFIFGFTKIKTKEFFFIYS